MPGGRAFDELFDHHDDQERDLWVDTIIFQQLWKSDYKKNI